MADAFRFILYIYLESVQRTGCQLVLLTNQGRVACGRTAQTHCGGCGLAGSWLAQVFPSPSSEPVMEEEEETAAKEEEEAANLVPTLFSSLGPCCRPSSCLASSHRTHRRPPICATARRHHPLQAIGHSGLLDPSVASTAASTTRLV